MTGLYLSSLYHFLFYLPNQMGRPIVLTTIVVVSTGCNDLFNFLFLLPHWGISCSAYATAFSWFLAALLLFLWLNRMNYYTKKPNFVKQEKCKS